MFTGTGIIFRSINKNHITIGKKRAGRNALERNIQFRDVLIVSRCINGGL